MSKSVTKKQGMNLAAIMLVFVMMFSAIGCSTTGTPVSTSDLENSTSLSNGSAETSESGPDEYLSDPIYQYIVEKEPDIAQYLDFSNGGIGSAIYQGEFGCTAYSKTRSDFPKLASLVVPLVNDYIKENNYSIGFINIMYYPDNDKDNAITWSAQKNNGLRGNLVDSSVDPLDGWASDLPYDQIKNYIDETTGKNIASQATAADASKVEDESSKEITYDNISTYEGYVDVCKSILEIEQSDTMTGEIIGLIEEHFPMLYASCKGKDVSNEEDDSWVEYLMLAFTYMSSYYEPDTIGYALGDYGLRALYYTTITGNKSYEFQSAIDDLKSIGDEAGLNLSTMLLVGKVSAGQYKVGIDIEPGEYLVLADSDSGYFSVSTDAAGKDIEFNDNFKYNSYITIKSGEYLKLSRCSAYPVDKNEIELDKNGEGMFRVGIDLPAGEYKLIADSDSGYYCVYSDSRQEDIVANDNFSGQSYITVTDGEYLKLSRCHIVD